MRELVVFFALVSSACSGWQAKSLTYAAGVAHQAREQARPAIDEQCMSRAETCAEAGDAVCQPLLECQAKRRVFAKSLMTLNYAVIDAKLAMDLGSSNSVNEAISRALQLAAAVVEQMKKFGVSHGG